MADYIALWGHYSIQFNKTLEFDCEGDWDRLDQEEREIAGLWKLLEDTYNGGFKQFFCNWGYTGYWYAMCGLRKIGDRELRDRLHRTYMEVFDKFKEDPRMKAYWDIPRYFTREDTAVLKQTDEYFWDTAGEAMARRAYEYYHDEVKKEPRKTPGQGETT